MGLIPSGAMETNMYSSPSLPFVSSLGEEHQMASFISVGTSAPHQEKPLHVFSIHHVCNTKSENMRKRNDAVFTWEFLLDSQCASKIFMIYLMSSALLYTSLPTRAFIFLMPVVIRTIPGHFIRYTWQVLNNMKN